MDHWQWQLNSDWLDLNLILFEGNTMTPAEIAKLTEQAKRGKVLMIASAAAGAKAGPILDAYEASLTRFVNNMDRVKSETIALDAAMAAMGNAGPILDAAFQDEESDNPVSAQPSEGAGLPKVNGG